MNITLALIAAGLAALVVWSLLAKPVPGCTPCRRRLPNPNANEPNVFASSGADLDPESDTIEPHG